MPQTSFNSDRATRFTRKSLRKKQHNYGWTGTYFVTIRAAEFNPLFEIPELHTILKEIWHTLPKRFPNLTLDEFVIMPNHVHFIVRLEGNVEKPTTLGHIIGAYKSLTAVAWLHHIETLGPTDIELPGHIWQRNYYDHIIRDALELEQKRKYIRDNPTRWKQRPETTQ